MNGQANWADLSKRLTAVLKLAAPPIGIAFEKAAPAGVAPFTDPVAAPNEAGRTGRVPAGCVFWMKAADRAFATVAEDHANCSVGSVTHGFLALADAVGKDDVQAVLASGWVSEADAMGLPHVAEKPGSVVYAPLAESPVEPDVVLVRINGLALMTLKDAFPDIAIEGKPQCHVIPMAKEQGRIAASVGCALSRARTGMLAEEMTCAIPAAGLADTVTRIEQAAELDRAMARYAAADAKRFEH